MKQLPYRVIRCLKVCLNSYLASHLLFNYYIRNLRGRGSQSLLTMQRSGEIFLIVSKPIQLCCFQRREPLMVLVRQSLSRSLTHSFSHTLADLCFKQPLKVLYRPEQLSIVLQSPVDQGVVKIKIVKKSIMVSAFFFCLGI